MNNKKTFGIAVAGLVLGMVITFSVIMLPGCSYLLPRKPYSSTQIERIDAIKDSALLEEVAAHLDEFYFSDVTAQQIEYGAAAGMCAALGDPYTRYLTPEQYASYMEDASGRYVGVGLVLSAKDTGELMVVSPYEGSPGANAGILPGDIILAVDGESVDGSKLDETAKKLRGVHLGSPEGTNVTITVRRDGGEPFDAVLTRSVIDRTSVKANMMDGGIGYLRISEFNSDTDAEFEKGISTLKNSGMKKMILDLRDNPGGDFNVAINIADYFVPQGSITVYTMDKKGNRQDYKSAGSKDLDGIPMVVLINEGSASASEVLCGAIRDHKRAKAIIGDKSFGKGITQHVFPLKSGGGMIITVDKYYTPSDECIHGVGITPDTPVKLPEDLNKLTSDLTFDEDLQLRKAVETVNSL